MTEALVQFLRARLDEDEQAADRAAALCGCHPAAASWEFRDGDDEEDGRIHVVDDPHPILLGKRRRLARRWNRSCDGLFAAQHIVRHDPARVLAEVDAKRQALDHYERIQGHTLKSDGGADYIFAEGAVRKQLQFMALAYADHPDYRAEWAPDQA